MTPADLTDPFGESCCDGGDCSQPHQSAKVCGCDPSANWKCFRHRYDGPKDLLKEIYEFGCPLFMGQSSIPDIDGYLCCHYCSANVEKEESHEPDCLWLKVKEFYEQSFG